jgi:predicted SnoaL-like aldol condensation-catalyzing enzyme
MSAEDNKVLVRRFYEDGWNKHNPAIVDEIYAADYVDRSPVVPGFAPTREGLKEFMRVYLRGFPDAHITVEDQLVEGDSVVTRTALERSPAAHGHATERQAVTVPVSRLTASQAQVVENCFL